MGQTGRGEDAESPSYLDQTLASTLQGNIIDLLPGGRLNSKPYALPPRALGAAKTESVDVMERAGKLPSGVDTGPRGSCGSCRATCGVNEEWFRTSRGFSLGRAEAAASGRPFVRGERQAARRVGPRRLAGRAAEALKGATKIAGLVGDLVPTRAAFAAQGSWLQGWASAVGGAGGWCDGPWFRTARPMPHGGMPISTGPTAPADRLRSPFRGAGAARGDPQAWRPAVPIVGGSRRGRIDL